MVVWKLRHIKPLKSQSEPEIKKNKKHFTSNFPIFIGEESKEATRKQEQTQNKKQKNQNFISIGDKKLLRGT